MADTEQRDDIRPGTLDAEQREVLSLTGLAWLSGVVAVVSALWGLLGDGAGPPLTHRALVALVVAGFALVGAAAFAVCACVRSATLRVLDRTG